MSTTTAPAEEIPVQTALSFLLVQIDQSRPCLPADPQLRGVVEKQLAVKGNASGKLQWRTIAVTTSG